MYRAKHRFVACTRHTRQVAGLTTRRSHGEPGEGRCLDPVRIESDRGRRVDLQVGQVTSETAQQFRVVRAATADKDETSKGAS